MQKNKKTALLFLLLLLAARYDAQAAPTIINFSCNGKITAGNSEAPINNMGLVLNLVEKTITFSGFVSRIDTVDDASVSFSGEDSLHNSTLGSMDRITGSVDVMMSSGNSGSHWEMLCKPTSRLF